MYFIGTSPPPTIRYNITLILVLVIGVKEVASCGIDRFEFNATGEVLTFSNYSEWLGQGGFICGGLNPYLLICNRVGQHLINRCELNSNSSHDFTASNTPFSNFHNFTQTANSIQCPSLHGETFMIFCKRMVYGCLHRLGICENEEE